MSLSTCEFCGDFILPPEPCLPAAAQVAVAPLVVLGADWRVRVLDSEQRGAV